MAKKARIQNKRYSGKKLIAEQETLEFDENGTCEVDADLAERLEKLKGFSVVEKAKSKDKNDKKSRPKDGQAPISALESEKPVEEGGKESK